MSVGIGLRNNTSSTQATGAATITAGDDEVYTFTTDIFLACVVTDPDIAGKVRVGWNRSAMSASTACDAILNPGDVAYSPQGLKITTVALYSTGNKTVPNDLCVVGW